MGFQDLVYNKKDAETAREFCKEQAVDFELKPMYVHSVEDNIKFRQEPQRFTLFYKNFLDLESSMDLMKTNENTEKCQFKRSTITLNFDGRIYRCCGVYEQKYFMGSFFDYRIRDIPVIESGICDICGKTPIGWR